MNKIQAIIISSHDVTNKTSSPGSNKMVDVVIKSKFGKSSIYERSYHNPKFIRIWPEKSFFWFKFNKWWLALGITLKFWTSVAKVLILNFRELWGANSYICRSYRGKAGRRVFLHPLNWIVLTSVLLLTYHNLFFYWCLLERSFHTEILCL